MAVSVDYNLLAHSYFYFDKPVPYKLKKGEIRISPISLKDSEVFLLSVGILTIDKNSLPDVAIIQMSYLQFISQILLTDERSGAFNIHCFYNILTLCLGLKRPSIKWRNQQTPCICDEATNVEITPKEFDDIKGIILHQNFPHYNDDYIDPDLKKAMDETDELKNKDQEVPSIERKIAIITAHTGLPKREQILMTYRSHNLLFEEVCGETEFITIRPPLIARGAGDKIDHWIFKKKKDKFDGYIKTVDSYTQSMGGSANMKISDSSQGDFYTQQFNDFTQK